MTLPARGELWWCETTDAAPRPVVVLSRDVAIPRLRRVLVAPCTTTVRGLASEVVPEPGADPVPQRAAVNLDLVESVPVASLGSRLGRLESCKHRRTTGRCRSRLPVIPTPVPGISALAISAIPMGFSPMCTASEPMRSSVLQHF